MNQMRPKPQVMRLTERAAERIGEIMSTTQKQAAGLRIGVKNGGCAGMEYTMDYAQEPEPLDEVIEERGVKLFLDAKAVLFLLGTEMDYKTDAFQSGFSFTNPNAKGMCGCGESFHV